MYNNEEIGKRIREKRKDLKLSQDRLGKKINVVGKQISNYENGKLSPPIEVLFRLCDVFNCELGYLLGEETYSAGTQLDTAIENKTGLKKETINTIVKITGTEKKCFEFGHQSEKYRKILNNFLMSENFLNIIKEIFELDYIYNQDTALQKLLKEWGDERFNRVLENHNNTQEESKDSAKIEEAKEDNIKMDFLIASYRFRVQESFTSLLNELYPKKPSEKINFP